MQNPFLCKHILSLAVKQFQETGNVSLSFRNSAVLMVEVLMSNIKFNSKHHVTDFTKMGKDETEQLKMKVELKKVFEACFQCITDQDGDFSFHGHLRVGKEGEDVFVKEDSEDDDDFGREVEDFLLS